MRVYEIFELYRRDRIQGCCGPGTGEYARKRGDPCLGTVEASSREEAVKAAHEKGLCSIGHGAGLWAVEARGIEKVKRLGVSGGGPPSGSNRGNDLEPF